MLGDLIQMKESKKTQVVEHIRFKCEGKLVADTNPATLTTITDIYKSKKRGTTFLRAVVHDTFLICTFYKLLKFFLNFKKNLWMELLRVQRL